MKRPSVIDDVEADLPVPVSDEGELPRASAPGRKVRPDVQHTSVYIPRAAHERLREIAFIEHCKVHDLIMQGVDRVIAERGHPERAKRSTTAF